MRGHDFYGLPLVFENMGEKEDEVFGFVWLTGGEVVRLAPVMQFLQEKVQKNVMKRTRPVVQSGIQVSLMTR